MDLPVPDALPHRVAENPEPVVHGNGDQVSLVSRLIKVIIRGK